MDKYSSKEKEKAANISILSNFFLTVFKFIVGFLTGSISIISESIHSFVDLSASLITRYSVKKSEKPPDKEHNYGHGKIENFSSFIEALLIIFVSIFIIYESIEKIFKGQHIEFIEIGIIIMLLSGIINFFVSRYLYYSAKKYHSPALEADAAHLITDTYTALGIFIGLIVVKITSITILDPLIAIFIAIMIFRMGLKILIRSTNALYDVSLSDEERRKIEEILNKHEKFFISCHKIRTRMSGGEIYLDFHLTFPKDTTIEKAHSLAGLIKKDIIGQMPNANVIIHIEPCNSQCKTCSKKEICSKI